MTAGGTAGWEYFVSYTQADRAAAEWIAYELENTGARVLIQAWDSVPGTNWPELVHRGVTTAKVLIPVLSADYLTSAGGTAEWQAVWAADIPGRRRRVVPVLMVDADGLDLGLAGTRTWIDLHDLSGADVATARARLLNGLNAARAGRVKPTGRVPFPGGRSGAQVNADHRKWEGSRTPPPPSGSGRQSPAPETRQQASEPAVASEATSLSTVGFALRPARRATSRIYDAHRTGLENGHPRRLIDPSGPAVAVAFAPHRPVLAAAFCGPSGGVWQWDMTDPAADRKIGSPLTGAFGGMMSVAFAPNGTTLAAGGADGRLFRWDVTSAAVPRPVGPPLTGPTEAAFAPDGRTLAAGSYPYREPNRFGVYMWDVTDRAYRIADAAERFASTSREDYLAEAAGTSISALSVAFSLNGTILASGRSDGTVRQWDVTDPAARQPRGPLLGRCAGPVRSLAFAPNGRTLAAAGGAVSLWIVK
jgi:TIR domain/WD domain, G-beta repeat